PRRRLWEQAVLLPGRIATLPFSALDNGTNRLLLMAERHALLTRLAGARQASAAPAGLALQGPGFGDRAGLGVQVEAHASLFRKYHRVKLSVAQAFTNRDYQGTHVRLFGENHLEYDL